MPCRAKLCDILIIQLITPFQDISYCLNISSLQSLLQNHSVMPPKAPKGKQVPPPKTIPTSSASHRKIEIMDDVVNIKKEDSLYQFPNFFNVYMPRSSSRMMKIPPSFGQRIPEGPIPRNLFLRNRCGKRFSVGLGSRGNDLFIEGDGWVQFTRDNGLVENHILVFFFNGTDTFDIKIFERNGCEKVDEDGKEVRAEVAAVGALEVINKTEEDNDKDDAEEGEEEEEEKLVERKRGKGKEKERKKIDIYGADIFRSGAYSLPANPYFVTRVRRGRKDMVYIPSDVVKDLKYELGETLNVRDQRGRSYTLKLKAWDDGRRWYRDGWRRLCESNLVGERDRLICEFIEMDEQQSVEMRIFNIIRAGNSSN